ncbi:MAG TPA: pseudouridine synthase [Clostridia bacterium]
MRINRYLALCGVASRRKSEQIIAEKRVKLNGRLIEDLAVDVNPEKDIVTVDGKKVSPVQDFIYIMLNKPKGYVTTTSDEHNRLTVMDLIKLPQGRRVYPVGRLDYDTEGLLLLTDDGDLTNILTHPSHKINKTYVARIKGVITPDEIRKLSSGVEIDGRKTAPCRVRVLEIDEKTSRLEITIYEGRNRQVRKMLESIGKDTEFLKRISIGDIRLGGLTRGKFRYLNDREIAYLLNLKEKIDID